MSPNRHYRGTNEAARVIMIVADVLGRDPLGLWILMYLLDANRGNDLGAVRPRRGELAGRLVPRPLHVRRGVGAGDAGYGARAVAHLFVGHAVANRMRRY